MKRFLPFIIIIIIIIALASSAVSFFTSLKNEKSAINKLGIDLKYIGKFLTAQLTGYPGGVNTNIATKNYNYDYIPPVAKEAAGQSGSYVPQKNTQILSEAVDTFITSGPNDGDILESANGVTFRFDAQVPSEKRGQQITFETKVSGLDNAWQTTYGKERIINFPIETKQYVFSVRVIIGNLVDQTPATRSFSVEASF